MQIYTSIYLLERPYKYLHVYALIWLHSYLSNLLSDKNSHYHHHHHHHLGVGNFLYSYFEYLIYCFFFLQWRFSVYCFFFVVKTSVEEVGTNCQELHPGSQPWHIVAIGHRHLLFCFLETNIFCYILTCTLNVTLTYKLVEVSESCSCKSLV